MWTGLLFVLLKSFIVFVSPSAPAQNWITATRDSKKLLVLILAATLQAKWNSMIVLQTKMLLTKRGIAPAKHMDERFIITITAIALLILRLQQWTCLMRRGVRNANLYNELAKLRQLEPAWWPLPLAKKQ